VFVLRDLQYRGTYSLREKTFRFQENNKFLARYFFAKVLSKISLIFAKKISQKLAFFVLAKNFAKNIQDIFAKIFAKIGFFRFRENFYEKYTKLSRK
jgi:hypothetical protein